jgi:putative transposase
VDTVRKTFKEKRRPTPAQERALDEVLWRCRVLYNTALAQRKTAWERRHVTVGRYEQEAELKDIRAAFPEYAAIHSHILQDVLARLQKTYDAFIRRAREGEKPSFPRFQGRTRWHSFTYKEYGNGARLDNGYLVLSKIGRIAVRWSRPLEGTPKTVTLSKEADGWCVAISCAEVPTLVRAYDVIYLTSRLIMCLRRGEAGKCRPKIPYPKRVFSIVRRASSAWHIQCTPVM